MNFWELLLVVLVIAIIIGACYGLLMLLSALGITAPAGW